MLTETEIVEGNELINEFMNASNAESYYYTDIGALWPVMRKCKDLAQANQQFLATPWFAIAMFLYQVPDDLEELYNAVVFFIKVYVDLKGIAPVCDN